MPGTVGSLLHWAPHPLHHPLLLLVVVMAVVAAVQCWPGPLWLQLQGRLQPQRVLQLPMLEHRCAAAALPPLHPSSLQSEVALTNGVGEGDWLYPPAHTASALASQLQAAARQGLPLVLLDPWLDWRHPPAVYPLLHWLPLLLLTRLLLRRQGEVPKGV